MKKAALICVTRNNAAKLQTTLNSIIRNTKPENYDLFLIDNASSDETLGLYQLKVLADNITIVRSGKNLHWVGGINLGLEMTKGYQYVGFLNDDIEVGPNWLENFFDVLDCNADVGAVGPITSNTRDWQGYDKVRDIFKSWRLPELEEVNRNNVQAMHHQVSKNGSGTIISGMLAFFCVLIRRSVIDRIGYLDANFTTLYLGDDDDYCDRIKHAGFKLALSTRTYVAHYSGNSSLLVGDFIKRQKDSHETLHRKRLLRNLQKNQSNTAE
jgi:GT2 family glycosyltransferase